MRNRYFTTNRSSVVFAATLTKLPSARAFAVRAGAAPLTFASGTNSTVREVPGQPTTQPLLACDRHEPDSRDRSSQARVLRPETEMLLDKADYRRYWKSGAFGLRPARYHPQSFRKRSAGIDCDVVLPRTAYDKARRTGVRRAPPCVRVAAAITRPLARLRTV
jgi:hypothetical protein